METATDESSLGGRETLDAPSGREREREREKLSGAEVAGGDGVRGRESATERERERGRERAEGGGREAV